MKKLRLFAAAMLAVLGLTACGKGEQTANKEKIFTPGLDTNTVGTIDIAGFMGNFEALDEVINAFNEIYPNVVFAYDHNTTYMLSEYLANNTANDIFMTDDANIRTYSVGYSAAQFCMDLSTTDIDTSVLRPEIVKMCSVDGQLLRLPIAMNTCGIVVNETLLEKEGLEIPKNYEEFLKVMQALKDKGYTPLQGSQNYLYGNLMVNMAMNVLKEDENTVSLLQSGDAATVETIRPVFARLEEIITKGYTDYELNCTFPEDNYDGSILSFFEGNMPFYVCNSECVSGMKKRESKSETFSAQPFEYTYLYAPIGDEGAFAYQRPWYGFSINKNSDNKEMAAEFLRFMMNWKTLGQMASTKGLPAAVENGTDDRYSGIKNQENIEDSFYNDGSVPERIRQIFEDVCMDFGAGVYHNADEAAQAFVAACAQ